MHTATLLSLSLNKLNKNMPLIFGFLLLFISFNSAGVQRDIYFNNLSLEQGLKQSSIYSLARDPFGFTWIGTQDGLHRFDGKTIELVRLSTTQRPKYRYIRDISVINNQLYVATTDGLVIIDLLTGNKSYPEVHDSSIYSVIEVNQQIWLGSDAGLLVLNENNKLIDYFGDSSLVSHVFCLIPTAPKRCTGKIRTLIFDVVKQTVWLGTDNGLFELNLKKKQSIHGQNLAYIDYHQVDSKHAAGNAIRKLFIDSYHHLWIATYFGLHYLSIESVSDQTDITHIYHHKDISETIASNRVLAIAQDNNGDILIGTSNGLSRHQNSLNNSDIDFNQGWKNFQTHNASSHSLIDNFIRSLLTDSEGRLWVGTNKGVSVTNTQRDKVAIYRAAENNSFNNYILSLTEESTHKYWIGTQKGLYIFDNKVATLLPELKNYIIYDTLIIADFIWATTRNGLYKISLKTHKISQYFDSSNSPIDDAFIYKILSVNNSIWLGTTAGLHQLNLENNQWQSWYKKDGLVGDEVYSLYSHRDKLFIGTTKGLSIFDLNQKTFKNFSPQNSSLASRWIFNIHHLTDDRFLIASDGGIYEFNSTTEHFDYIGITQGNAYGLTQDDQGYFWVTSNNGLFRYNASSRAFKKFFEKDGFASNEYNLNASLKNSQGELLLGTINGFVIFNPEHLSQNKYSLQSRVVSSIKIDNKRYSLWEKLPLTNNIAIFRAKDFSLNWNDTKVELQLTNPYFAIATPPQSKGLFSHINLSNIQSGLYSMPLSLKADNLIYVIKQPHPLLSWWAIITYILLFSVLLIFLVRYRLINKFNKKILLNHEIITSQKNEIEKHLLFKQSLYLQIQHSFKSPVFACRGLSKQIATQLSKKAGIDQESIERKNNKLFKALNEISALIDEFIVLTKKPLTVNTRVKQYIIPTLVKLNDLMTDVASSKNISLHFIQGVEITELDYVFASEKCLYLILENVLSNAIKFSQHSGDVQLVCSKVLGYLVIKIIDNGCGFSSKDLSNIFTLYYRGENSHQYNGSGVGLTTAKQLLHELNGEINFEKNSPCGTIVTIKIILEE